MTYTYGEDNDKKRGPRWLLTHCAFCGDPHQVYPYGCQQHRANHDLPMHGGHATRAPLGA